MKLIAKNFEKDSSGSVVLVPDEAEDMWHAYNLIAVGDHLRSTTIRRVQTESATGSVSSNKVRTTLCIAVARVEFDTQACMLRINGRNVQENQYVKMGAYHTIDLELNRKFTLIKEYWDIIALERVEMACDPAQHADLGAILLHEGLCHICLVTSSMTIVRAKIDMNIPRKRKGFCGQHDKGLFKFYDAIIQGILRHINFEVIKCILVASPGFVKDQFCDYMFQQAVKNDWKAIIDNKSKFLLAHSSSGHKHSLKEVLADPTVTARLADTKASSEVKALDNFFTMLHTEPDRAYYGVTHVEKANEALAIETLLVTDELFRSGTNDNDIFYNSGRQICQLVKDMSSLLKVLKKMAAKSGFFQVYMFLENSLASCPVWRQSCASPCRTSLMMKAPLILRKISELCTYISQNWI